MAIFDSIDEIIKLDEQNVLSSIDELSKQVDDAFSEAGKVVVPESYRDVDNIVMCGMGGSGLGARVIESLYGSSLKFPLTRVNDYHLPAYVSERSLVICSSYSGETEETIQNAREAVEKKAKWMAIGTGNSIIHLADENNVPFYKIDPKYNPSNQPRMAIGYSIVGQLVLASKTGLFDLARPDFDKAISVMNEVVSSNNSSVPTENNEAKKLALKMKDHASIFISAEHLVGATHVVNNQQNENSKNLSFDTFIPELNHHLMEGLKYPENNKNGVFVIFFNSDLYSDRIKQRFDITSDVVSQNNIESFTYKAKSDDKLAQVFEIIQFGAYVNFYLSMLNGLNPAPIPWVDYFKEKLGQPLGK